MMTKITIPRAEGYPGHGEPRMTGSVLILGLAGSSPPSEHGSIDPQVRSNAERSHCAQSAAALYSPLEIVHQSIIW